MNIEDLKKLLEEKNEQRTKVEIIFNQLSGQIVLLKELIEKIGKEDNTNA